jgi:hypothetical protein
MGLLDSLFSGSGDGGILGFLRNNALNQDTNTGGMASDRANYGPPMFAAPSPPIMAAGAQPSLLGTAQWPSGPMSAPSSANAQMPPQQPPPIITAQPQMQPSAQPQQEGGLGAGFRGLMANAHTGPIGAILGGVAGLAGMGQGSPQQQQAKINNVTAQALLQKGVDPTVVNAAITNPEIMKTLVTQTFGPQTVQSLGDGYIADKTGKISRAYEPEDKIPAGFTKGDDGNLHFLPGGPADPAYQRLIAAKAADPNAVFVLGKGGELYKKDAQGNVSIVHRNEDTPQPMDPAATEILARREIGGDFSGRKNLGRGAQGAADLRAITNKSADILTNEMGMSPAEASAHLLKQQQQFAAQGQGLNSEARTTGVREANLNLILKAADAAIPAALEASDKVARTGWVPLNQIIQGGQVIASNPDLKKFGMANLQLAEHWARAMNPTGVMRESDRDKALEYLSTKDSKETYREAVGQLRTQIERERDAVKATRGMTDLPGSSSPAPGAGPKPGAYVWSPDGGVKPK